MTDSNYTKKLINDPIHCLLEIQGNLGKEYVTSIKDIIDSSIFQRLRHIKQLGTVNMIFPSAVHTRFEHCLGVAHLANKMMQELKNQIPKNEEDIKAFDIAHKYAVVSALLHDIGHGPMSHDLESMFKVKNSNKKIKHEQWTKKFLELLHNHLEKIGLDIEIMCKMIKGENLKKIDNKYLSLAADVVSSQLDADRLDYLLRDSYFCGVSYGLVDIEWIISNITIVYLQNNSNPRLGIWHKGHRAVEHFFNARRIMTQSIYKHHKKQIISKLIIELLSLVTTLIGEGKELSFIDSKSSLYKFLKILHRFIIGEMSMEAFIDDAFRYYQNLTDADIWVLIRDIAILDQKEYHHHAHVTIAKALYDRRLHKSYLFRAEHEDHVKGIVADIINKNACIMDYQMFLDNKEIKMYDFDEMDKKLYVKNHKGSDLTIIDISQCSPHIKNEKDVDSYLFIDKELLANERIRMEIESKLNRYINF